MKKFAVLSVLLAVLTTAHSQMQAVFAYSTFYAPGADMPYVETYLSFDAWTMQFVKQANGTYRATAEVVTMLKQGDSVCYVKKYDLNSPVVDSLNKLDFSFLDVQRFSVKNGIYDLEITLRDKGSERPAATVTEKLVVNYDKKHPAMSSLQLMSSVKPTEKENVLSRGGYDMEPYVSDFFPEQVGEIHYYFEVYNINKEVGDNAFLVLAYIEQQETGSRFESLQTSSRKHGAVLVPVYGSLDISQLPSGNYNLVVELRNKAGEKMLYKKVPFFRSNPGVKEVEVSDFATTFVGRGERVDSPSGIGGEASVPLPFLAGALPHECGGGMVEIQGAHRPCAGSVQLSEDPRHPYGPRPRVPAVWPARLHQGREELCLGEQVGQYIQGHY